MSNLTKIITFKQLGLIKRFYDKKKIVLAHGAFDFFHYGHFLHLKKAKSLGQILVVTLTADKFIKKGPGRPFYNQQTRINYLKEMNFTISLFIGSLGV